MKQSNRRNSPRLRFRGSFAWCLGWLAGMIAVSGSVSWADEVNPAVLEAEQTRAAAIAKAVRSTISVFGPGGAGGGSGVVITPDGYALTNYHVSKPAGSYMQCSLPDGNLYDAVIVGIDPTGDVALIKLLGRDDFPPAETADSDQVRVGDWCFAVGNPFLLATDFQPTVTYGIVSGVHRYQYPAGTLLEYADCIQTDASINPGNSGGPLFNAEGQLIGINGRGSFEKRGRVNVGVGYAISINQIKNFLGYLHSGRIVDHATLGATVSSGEQDNVVVTNILTSCDAYRRGLRYGDEIVAFGGRQITTVNGFKNALGIFPRGWRVPLSYRRDGIRYDVLVRLEGVHSQEELISKIQSTQQRPQPRIPQPDQDKPDPENPEDPETPDDEPQPGEDPEQPERTPAMRNPHDRPMPEEVKKLFQERRGYANYHFNLANRERVWEAQSAHGDFESLAGDWKLSGEMARGGKIQITLGEESLSGRFPVGLAQVELAEDLGDQLDPIGSGGLLVALHTWKRLLVQGPARFGEVYYLGTAPVLEREGLFDVLVGTHNVVESRFYFDPTSGHLIALEMYPDTEVDPCEVYFDDYREVSGRMLPHRMIIRFGDDLYGDLRLDSIELPTGNGNDETT